MDSVNNEGSVGIEVVIRCRPEKQKYLIEFVLAYSCLKLSELANLLGVSVRGLAQAQAGSSKLPHSALIKLVDIFCMLFSS